MVERTLGKGEVECSIHSGGTIYLNDLFEILIWRSRRGYRMTTISHPVAAAAPSTEIAHLTTTSSCDEDRLGLSEQPSPS